MGSKKTFRVKPSTTINDTIPVNTSLWKIPEVPSESNIIYGIKNQTEGYSTYAPECSHCNSKGCYAGECSAFTKWDDCSLNSGRMIDATNIVYTPSGGDYTNSYQNCYCSTKPVCSRPNYEECKLGPGSSGDEPTYRADWSDEYADSSTVKNPRRKLKCIWDLTKIDSVDQISKYYTKFKPSNNDPDYAKIMTKFCAVKTKNCLVDPTTNIKIDSCSRVSSSPSDPANALCRNWFEGASDSTRNAFIYNVCASDTGNTVECKCYNRASLKEYQAVVNIVQGSSAQPIEDACWYLPCKKSSPAYLVDSKNSTPKCPSQICQQIISASHTGGNVDIQNNQNILNCTFTQDDFDSSKSPTAKDLPDLPDLPDYKPSLWTPKGNSALGIFLIIMLFLAMLVILFPLFKKK